MNLVDVYNRINNPIDSYIKIKQFIELYFKSKDKKDFYNRVQNNFSVRRYIETNEKVLNEEKRNLALLIFHNWRTKLINTTAHQVPIDKYELDYKFREFNLLQAYLKSVDDIEVNFDNELTYETSDKDIDNAFRKYKFCEKDSEWFYIDSYYIDVSQNIQMIPEHILSLNINSKVTLYKFINYFIKECNRRFINYDFKFSEDMYRDNNIVIFSDNKNLTNYLEIIAGIEKFNKELFLEVDVSIDRPSLLSGTIGKCSWLGYSSNSTNYYEKRLDIIYDSIDCIMEKWYDEEFNMRDSDKKDETYKSYILGEIVTTLVRKLYNEEMNQAVQYLYQNKIKREILKYSKLSWKELSDVNIKIQKGKILTFTKNDLYKLIVSLLGSIQRNDIDMYNMIFEEIRKRALKNNIDPDKFCLDIDTLESMKIYDSKVADNSIIMPCTTKTTILCSNSGQSNNDIYIDSSSNVWSSYNDYLNHKRANEKIKLKKRM